MNKFAIGYQRVSSQEQVSNFSLENQEDYIRKTSQAQGYELLKVFSDPGYSAKDTNRPGLIKMLQYCQENKGKIQGLYIYKIDRLSRETSDYLSIKLTLDKLGVKIINCTEPTSEDPSGEFTETMLAALAKLDNRIKSQRTLDGMRKRLESGQPLTRPPLGYTSIEIDGKKMIRPDNNFDLVKRAWVEMGKGIYSCHDMAKAMNKWGLKTVWGKKEYPITFKQAARVFRSKFYMGIIENERWGDHKGDFEAMITEDEFYRVQAIIDGKRPAILSYQRNNSDFPLRRFFKCSECGDWFTGAWSKGRKKKYPYYFCQKHRKSYKRKLAHQKFIRLLAALKPKPKHALLFSEVLKERYLEKIKLIEKSKKIEENEIIELEKKKQRLIEKNLSGVYDDKLFKQQIEIIENSIESKRSKKVINNLLKVNIDQLQNFMVEFMTNLDQYWSMGELRERQLIQGSIFPNGLVYERLDYRTAEISPSFNLLLGIDAPTITYGVADEI